VAHTSFRFKQISQNKLKFSDTLLEVHLEHLRLSTMDQAEIQGLPTGHLRVREAADPGRQVSQA